MKRTGRIARHTPLKSGKRIKAKPRTKQERTRIYGTDAHQDWLREHPCLICAGHPVELAHTANGGMGRKADARTQVPLCAWDHQGLHRMGVRTFGKFYAERLLGRTLAEWAWAFADAWSKRAGLTPLSAIVPGVVAKILKGDA